jgi:CHAT domain-containing protein
MVILLSRIGPLDGLAGDASPSYSPLWYASRCPSAIHGLCNSQNPFSFSPGMEVLESRIRMLSILGATSLALSLAVLGTCRTKSEALYSISSWRQRFISAAGSFRPCQGRIAGGLGHAIYSPSANRVRVPARAVAWVRELGREKNSQVPSARTLSDAALVGLLDGRLELAVATLVKAASLAPEDGPILSDLAAALIARGDAAKRPHDFVLAVRAAERATQFFPSLLEARFNLALALEKALLEAQASAAWQEYLRLDGESAWGREAASHLKGLVREPRSSLWKRERLGVFLPHSDQATIRQMVNESRQEARMYVEEVLLPGWAKALDEGRNTEAEGILATARGLARALASVNGDFMAADSVAVVDAALAGGQPENVRDLMEGFRAYYRGLELHRGLRDREAEATFERASDLLARSMCPLSLWARLRVGFCGYYRGDPALPERLDRLQEETDSFRYPSLASRLLSLRGMANGRTGRLAESLADYQQALSGFERLRESENIAALSFMIGENLGLQGDVETAWRFRYRALRLARDCGSSLYVHNTLLDSAEAALKEDLPEVALRFQSEMVQAALLERDPLSAVESLFRRSRAHQEIGDDKAARRDLTHAERWLDVAPETDRDQRLRADLATAAAEVRLRHEPEEAIELLSSAISSYERRQDRFLLPGLYQKRAQACLAIGDVSCGEKDLKAAIGELEEQRGHLVGRQLRAAYLDQAQAVFDQMILLQVQQHGQPAEAFESAERYRTQDLRQERRSRLPGSAASGLPSAREIQRLLPADVALIEYRVFADRTLAWVLTRQRFSLHSLSITRAHLKQRIDRLRLVLWEMPGSREERELLAELHQVLVLPLAADLDGSGVLIVVPDKEIHLVPFAALIDGETRHYLIQDRTVGYAPSATLYVRLVERDLALAPGSAEEVLVIGNPAFDHHLFGLADLPHAEEEARRVAALYPRSRLLIGAEATSAALLAEAPRHEVVHIAAHAEINPDDPSLSVLIMAPSAGLGRRDSGALYAYEIEGLSLPRTQLVILSGCSTATGRLSASEGVFSFAGPLLAAGVPAVVGSLWRAGDQASAELFVEFHRALRRGRSPLTALREAQIHLLASPDQALHNPALWAGFELVGAARQEQSFQ